MLPTHKAPPRATLRSWTRAAVALIATCLSLAATLPPALAATTTPSFPVPESAKIRPTGSGTSTTPTTTYTPQSATPPTGTATTSTTSPPKRSVHSTRANKLSTLAIALIVLAALLILACATWVAARLSFFEPRWARSARHALAEGGFRLSATWAEFTDWVRLGR